LVHSTAKTSVSVFANKEAFLPGARIAPVPVPEAQQDRVRKSIEIQIPDMTLDAIPHPEQAGALIGVGYNSIQGGKRSFRHGIYSFALGLEIHISGRTPDGRSIQQTVKCAEDGLFRPAPLSGLSEGELPEGRYILSTARRKSIAEFSIRRGVTEIRNAI